MYKWFEIVTYQALYLFKMTTVMAILFGGVE